MPRYLLVAGVDFGTSFTKVVIRDNSTTGSAALVVTFPLHETGLLPSLVGLQDDNLLPPAFLGESSRVPYLKMLAAHAAAGQNLDRLPIRIPLAMAAMRKTRLDLHLIRELLAYYFAYVMAGTENYVRNESPWKDFNFTPGNGEDFLVFQLAVPSGLLDDRGSTEKLFRDAFIAAHELKDRIDPSRSMPTSHPEWAALVESIFSQDRSGLEAKYQWQCLLYPEVAAAVQTVLRSPNALDGLYITMDVGAGTVDLNTFRRFTGHKKSSQPAQRTVRNLDYYSAMVCPLGVQQLDDPHQAVRQMSEAHLMRELRANLRTLFQRAQKYQPNLNHVAGQRTWDRSILYIFGGGSHHPGYKAHFEQAMSEAGIDNPKIFPLPKPSDIKLPERGDFGRFAVAYGLSYFRPNLDTVRLPHELKMFDEIYPGWKRTQVAHYGFNWED